MHGYIRVSIELAIELGVWIYSDFHRGRAWICMDVHRAFWIWAHQAVRGGETMSPMDIYKAL